MTPTNVAHLCCAATVCGLSAAPSYKEADRSARFTLPSLLTLLRNKTLYRELGAFTYMDITEVFTQLPGAFSVHFWVLSEDFIVKNLAELVQCFPLFQA